MELGEKIKAIRKRKKYTLKKLSEETNLSIGFLSNVERNLNSPSISSLQQICRVLGVNLMEILESKNNDYPVTRTKEREKIFSNVDAHVKVESLLNGKSPLNGISITIEGGSDFNDMSWGHGYDEIGIVIKGELEIEIDKKTYHLYEGDSVFIKESLPHRYKNPINSNSVVYWFSIKN